ncbi:MAG: DUF2062 domain-containing protein [Pontiellaceae bacterium]|nr:DUF2062 domain-containing protein [Pontiellaceae bacterium]
MRHPGTPESVGRGVAVGLFSAFFFPGVHMLIAFLLAMLVRGARGAAVLVTWITNPITIPFIWPVQCYLGSFMIGTPLSHARIESLLRNVMHEPSIQSIRDLGVDLILSFFAGGALFGSLMATAGYFCTTAMVRRHRDRMENRKQSRINHFKLKRGSCETD